MRSHNILIENEEPIEVIVIPYIHPKLNLEDLQTNGKLFSDAQIEAIKNNSFISNFQGRITKKRLNEIFKSEIDNNILPEFKFSLEKSGEDYRAIYKGKINSLGKGGFGAVKILQDLNTGETTEVLKVIKNNDTTIDEINNEKINLEKSGQFKSLNKRPEKSNQYEFVMELAKGDSLGKFINKKLPTIVWIDMIINVLEAVKNLHDKGILHCDLKPDNIHYDFITKKATIIDLGLASYISDTENIINGVRSEIPKGDRNYMSHDAQLGLNNEKSEIYALGITFAEILDLIEIKSKYFIPLKQKINIKTVIENDYGFLNNKIYDYKIRNELIKILKNMVSDHNNFSLNNIKNYKNIREVFHNIRDELINPLELKNNIVYLNIENYLCDELNSKEKILKILSEANEVWLIDNNGNNKKNYLNVQHELINYGINVSNTVIQYKNNNLEKVMQVYAEQREKTDHHTYDCSYIAKTGQLAHVKSTLDEQHIKMDKKIISKLKPPPLLQRKQPPPIPTSLQAEINTRKSPEYQNWMQNESAYAGVILATMNGMYKFINLEQKNKFKTFSNDELLHFANLYISLLDSANTIFQKAIIVYSLLENNDKKYNELKNMAIEEISSKIKEYPKIHKLLFQTLIDLSPVKINASLISIEKVANSENPFIFKQKIINQLKEIDPTLENIKEVNPKTQRHAS